MAINDKKSTIRVGFGSPIYSDYVKNYDDSPFVIKKVKKAYDTIKNVGLRMVKAK